MKKKFFVLCMLVVLVISLMISIVSATTVNSEKSFTEKDIEKTIEKKIINSEDFQFAESIEKKGEEISGNVYAMANNLVFEDTDIVGDVFIFANNVTLKDDVFIDGNIYIFAANVKIDASINRGLYVIAKDVVISSECNIGYDANIGAEHLEINGSFDRNLNTAVNNFEIREKAIISGDLNYTSDKEATVSEGAVVNKTNFAKHVIEKETWLDVLYDYVIDFTQYFVLTFVVLIFLIKCLPNFINKSKDLFNISSFGLGIISIIIAPIVFLGLLLLNFTSLVSIVGIIILVALLILSIAITNISIGSHIYNRHQKIKLPIAVALVTLVSWFAYQIPFVGGIINFFMITTGLGIILKSIFVKAKI